MTLKVLILGGSGLAGGYIASALLDRSDASVVLAARHEDRLIRARDNLAAKQEPECERISTAVVDAADPESLKAAMLGADIVVLAAQAKQYGAAIGRAALDSGADVIDITPRSGEHHSMEALRAEAEGAGRCLISDSGIVPGLPSALVRLLGGRLDRLDTVFVGVTSSNKEGWPEDTVSELVADIAHPPVFVWREGAWQKCRMAGMADRRKFDFGPEWGRRTCSPFFAEEMRDLPTLFPALRDAGMFIVSNGFLDSVAIPLAMLAMRVAPGRGHRPASRLVGWGMRKFSRPPFGVILKADATGERDGESSQLSVTVSHPSEYQATGLVVGAVISQWAEGPESPTRTPGLHPMGMVVDPERLLLDLAARGFLVS